MLIKKVKKKCEVVLTTTNMKSHCGYTVITMIVAFKSPSCFSKRARWFSAKIFTRTTHPK